MVDIRFHRFAGPSTIGDILATLGHSALLPQGGDADLLITGATDLELARPGDIALAAHTDYVEHLKSTLASAVIISPALLEHLPPTAMGIVTDRPHHVFVDLLDLLFPGSTRSVIASSRDDLGAPIFERDVSIGSNVVIGAGVEIGRGTVIGANTVIGAGVTIGRNCIIAANCTIDCAHLGNEVVIHSGVRIGTEGFGWLDFGRTNRKVPQLGRVLIQDRVEIGANSTIDRGALGDTMIGEGTKIDNLVQIGHNCRIGRMCLIAAMSGLSGTTVLEDGVLMGGGAGTSGHLTIGKGSVVNGRAAVTKDWPAGSKLAGAPAQDIRDFWREIAATRKLAKGAKKGMTDTVTESRELSAMSIGEILKSLPHRYPFLMIDKIIEIDGDETAIGIKNVTFNEPIFQGHFPENPIFPGVLIIEGMAQTAGAIVIHNDAGVGKKNVVLMLGVDKAKFRKPAGPGDVLEYHIAKIQRRRNVGRYKAEAIVSGVVIAEAEITAMIIEASA